LNGGIEATKANLDLILKWATLRFFDTNPSVLIRIMDYLGQVFQLLSEDEYVMADIEASAFVPYLLLKIGDPKDTVRASVHHIVQILVHVYSPQRVFSYVMEGLKSKNARQRAECLDELANMIAMSGMGVIHPSPAAALKEIAKQIGDRDNSVRNASLNAIVQAYFAIDEDKDKLYRLVGQVRRAFCFFPINYPFQNHLQSLNIFTAF
jgi:cytoskeleton-associated protein 5